MGLQRKRDLSNSTFLGIQSSHLEYSYPHVAIREEMTKEAKANMHLPELEALDEDKLATQ